MLTENASKIQQIPKIDRCEEYVLLRSIDLYHLLENADDRKTFWRHR